MKIVATLSVFLAAANANVVLHHRIFHPSFPDLRYLERGSISGNPPTFQPSESFGRDLETFAEALLQLEDTSDVLYQVALEHEGDSSQALWDFSSVKTCLLNKAIAETVVLHLADNENPVAMDYFVWPIHSSGSCQMEISHSAAMKSFAGTAHNLNTTVLLRSPQSPPLPELRAPPPLTPEGQVVQPVPEKSFIQKYWMYMVPILLVVLVTGGPEEEKPRQGGGGGH